MYIGLYICIYLSCRVVMRGLGIFISSRCSYNVYVIVLHGQYTNINCTLHYVPFRRLRRPTDRYSIYIYIYI